MRSGARERITKPFDSEDEEEEEAEDEEEDEEEEEEWTVAEAPEASHTGLIDEHISHAKVPPWQSYAHAAHVQGELMLGWISCVVCQGRALLGKGR